MNFNLLFEDLKKIYNYDDKLINALKKLLPALISYYGKCYSKLIIKALRDTQIISCNSYQTIALLKKDYELTKTYNENLVNVSFKNSDVLYLSNVEIVYKNEDNSYRINKTNRKILMAHTFNLDSPKGLEILTFGVVCLLKSIFEEYFIKDNYLYKKMGHQLEKKKIIYEESEIYLDLEEEIGVGFQLGLNIYDTELIMSLILKDSYKCYDYHSIFKIAMLLKEKLHLKEVLNISELQNKKDIFVNEYSNELYEQLLELCDKCMLLEQEMIMYASKREEKDDINKKLNNLLNNNIYDNLIKYMNFKKGDTVKSFD